MSAPLERSENLMSDLTMRMMADPNARKQCANVLIDDGQCVELDGQTYKFEDRVSFNQHVAEVDAEAVRTGIFSDTCRRLSFWERMAYFRSVSSYGRVDSFLHALCNPVGRDQDMFPCPCEKHVAIRKQKREVGL